MYDQRVKLGISTEFKFSTEFSAAKSNHATVEMNGPNCNRAQCNVMKMRSSTKNFHVLLKPVDLQRPDRSSLRILHIIKPTYPNLQILIPDSDSKF